ncbi:hypothetical protein F7F15_29075, partial [Escherichia coli]
PDMSERHFRDVSRLVYLTAMTKAGSNAGFFTATYVFLSSGTVSKRRLSTVWQILKFLRE